MIGTTGLLDRIVADGRAAVPIADVGGLGPELLALAEGLQVEVWASEDGTPLVTLTPVEAARRKLMLDSTGERWMRIGAGAKARPPRRTKSDTLVESDLVLDPGGPIRLHELPDPRAVDPAKVVEAAEAYLARVPARRSREEYATERLPQPTIITGIGAVWSGPLLEGEHCDAGHNGYLSPMTFCARCEKWGLDHMLPPRRATTRRGSSYQPGRLRGGRG